MRNIASIMSALSVALLALGIAGASPALAQEVQGPEVSWKYNVWGKRRAFTEGVETLAKYVSDKTGGNFTLKFLLGYFMV